jgi:PilX N-terminal
MKNRTANNEQGVALILTLFLMMALSVIGASLMLLSQTETYSSQNYRLMSQARYGAESGIQKTVNHLLYTYTPPTVTSATDPTADYDMTQSPVTCKAGACTVGQPIVLSANAAVASNYPIPAVQTAFTNGITGTLTAGSTSGAVSYATSALLLSMHVVNIFGGGQATIQTWQITSDGSVTATRTATVEVTSVLETPIAPANGFGAFGTSPTCGSLQFKGTSNTDSYDSSTAGFNPLAVPSSTNGGLADSGGNVGTNGNLGESGSATIYGTLSSPRVGVGACSDGNVDALTSSGNAKLCPDPTQACTGIQTGGVLQLPAAVSLPTPTAPSPMPPTTDATINASATCATIGLTAPTCTGAAGNLVINLNSSTVSLGNISLTGGANVTLIGSATAPASPNLTVNSITVSANSTLTISSGTSVVLNVGGKDASGNWLSTAVDFTGGGISNPGYNPSTFQIEYAGTGGVAVGGNSTTTAMVYAPKAAVTLNGNSDFYGSLIGATVVDNGNADIHYDRHLSTTFYTVGNAMMSAFSWKKY